MPSVYPFSDQKRPKSHTLWGGTYLYGLYRGVPPPPPPVLLKIPCPYKYTIVDVNLNFSKRSNRIFLHWLQRFVLRNLVRKKSSDAPRVIFFMKVEGAQAPQSKNSNFQTLLEVPKRDDQHSPPPPHHPRDMLWQLVEIGRIETENSIFEIFFLNLFRELRTWSPNFISSIQRLFYCVVR